MDQLTEARPGGRELSRRAAALLGACGVVLAVGTFVHVLRQPDFIYHPARDLELRATYETYRDTGVLLVKQNGTGSWYGAIEGAGLTRAAGDDDPGSYLVALLMSHLTGAASPYPGLRWAMALICALPMLLLPTLAARVFGRVGVGVAVLAVPLVTWLVTGGSWVPGSAYGLSDAISTAPVYALYAMPGAVVFGGLVMLGTAATTRPRLWGLVAVTVAVVLVAAFANLVRGMSGVGLALAVAVLWWSFLRERRGRAAALVGALAVAALSALASTALPTAVMSVVDRERAEVVEVQASRLTDANAPWDNFYLGLSWPQPITGEASSFGVPWSDEHAWQRAAEERPGVRPGTPEFDDVMKDVYLEEVRAEPAKAVRLYVEKTLYTARFFWAPLLVGLLGVVLVVRRGGAVRARALRVVLLAVPTLVIGLGPPVLVMPMLYYTTEIWAALSFVVVVAFAALAWAVLDGWDRARTRRARASH